MFYSVHQLYEPRNHFLRRLQEQGHCHGIRMMRNGSLSKSTCRACEEPSIRCTRFSKNSWQMLLDLRGGICTWVLILLITLHDSNASNNFFVKLQQCFANNRKLQKFLYYSEVNNCSNSLFYLKSYYCLVYNKT